MMRRPYRSARRRRRWGRYDPSPVLLVTEDDRTLYLGSAVRMAWRYRSELAPFWAALWWLVCGAWFHVFHPGAAAPLAALTAASTAVLGLPPSRWPGRAGRALVTVLDRWAVYSRRLERLYAASVVALAGSWLAAATGWGPGTAPLPAVLVLGTLAGGVPWWTHRRRRERVRVTRILDAWPTFSDSIGLPGSRVASAVVDRWGWSGRLALRRGQTVAQALAAAGAIESALAVRPGAVRIEPDPARADRAVLRVIETDPLADAVPWPGLPGADTTERDRRPSIVDPVELGLFEDAAPVLVRFAYRNTLIGGAIGAGKSGILNVILAFLVTSRDVAVWGIDLKGGMELRPWQSRLGRLATTPAGAVELLRRALDERDRRMHSIQGRLWDPAVHGPALIIVIDEFAELPQEGKELAESLSRVGRAVMVNLVIATQKPTQEALGGGALRSQCAIRICLRMQERRDVDLILDRGAWAAGWRGDLLDLPGKFLLSDPQHTIPRPARGYLITDQKVSTTAANADRQPVIEPSEPHQNHPDDYPNDYPDDDPGEDPQDGPEYGPVGDDWTAGPDGPDPEGRHATDPATVLWRLLVDAPPEGVTIGAMMAETRMSRPWVYLRLNEYLGVDRITVTSRGHYRAVHQPPDPTLT